MTDQFGTDQLTAEEQRLVEALAAEAGKLDPSTTALASIQQRISEAPTPLELARARRHRRTGVVAAVVALGLAAAATLFAVNGGLQRQTVPDPAQTPTAAPTTADTRFDPSVARMSWTVYRTVSEAGRPVLITEEVRAQPPYEPRQALDAMFATKPLDPRATDPNHEVTEPTELNTVASVQRSDDVIEVDLATVNPVKPYDSVDDAAWARAWTQTWVRTIQDAYGTDLPVLLTRRGQPFTLFGFVDTATPIKRDSLRVESSPGIFLPRPNEEVTSPVSLVAELPRGDQQFTITDRDTNATVFDETFEVQSARVIGYRPDLPRGRYTLDVVVRSTGNQPKQLWEYGLEFTVVGPDPSPVPPPVSDPATQPVSTIPVYFPAATGSGLVEEERAVTRPAEAVAAVLQSDPSSDPAQPGALLPGSEIASVTGDGSQVTVDFRDLGTAAPSREIARQRVQAILRTISASFGADAAVRFTLDGAPTGLYGLSVSESTRARTLPITRAPTFAAATADPLTHTVLINGRVPTVQTTLTWYLQDPVSNETRFQGVATIDPATRTYAFGVTVPAGDYLVELNRRSGSENDSLVLDVTA